MELEEQVCSLELSKKLKELGCTQKSLWYWVDEAKLDGEPSQDFHLTMREDFPPNSVLSYAAYTVAELGKLLPQCTLQTLKGSNDAWGIMIGERKESWADETEANARAKCLIYLFLLENKLMELPNDKA